MMEAGVRVTQLLEGGGMSLGMRTLWIQAKARQGILLQPPERAQACQHLDFSPVRLTVDF